jgi:hypothetical protein
MTERSETAPTEVRGFTWRCRCGGWPMVGRSKCHKCGAPRPADVRKAAPIVPTRRIETQDDYEDCHGR